MSMVNQDFSGKLFGQIWKVSQYNNGIDCDTSYITG